MNQQTNITQQIDNEESHKTLQWLDRAVFLLLFAIASVVTFRLFYHQTTGSEALFHSDMKAYILEMQGLDSGYSFPYPIFFKLSAFFHLFVNPELAVAIATLVLNSGAMVIVKLALNAYVKKGLEEAFPKAKWLAGALISLVTILLFFVSMLYPPEGIYLPGIPYHYLGVFTANPFHNATYMAARPFAVLTFLWFVKLLDVYENSDAGSAVSQTESVQENCLSGFFRKWREYILFSIFLLLATMTKPSFTIVLVGAAGLIMVWRMIRGKFRNLLSTIRLGLCFIPTFIDLLYQFKGVFVPVEGEEGGVGFTFGEIWGLYTDNLPLAICLAVGFPLAVLVLNYKELKTNTLYRFSWQIYLMSFVMAFFLYEKGFRWADFNFSWGYMYGIFFTFFGSVAVLLNKTSQPIGSRKRHFLWLALQWGPFLWHVACGLYYFYGIAQGAMYY